MAEYKSYIKLPSYGPSRWEIGLVIAGVALAMVAVVVPASRLARADWWAILLMCLGVTGAILAAAHTPYFTSWLRSQWRRATSYDDVVRRLGEVSAELILLKGPRPLRVLRVDRDVTGRGIEMILDLGPLNGVAEGEWLVVLDTVVRKQVGRARVARFHAGRCFAEFTPSDPVLDGYLREHASASHPEGIVAFRELDVQAGDRRLQELQAEAEPWQ